MKKLLSIVLILSFFGCQHDDAVNPQKGSIQFSFSDQKRFPGRALETGKPVSVLLTIQDANGNPVEQNKKLLLYTLGSGLVSESLQLPASSYQLTQFIVLDSGNNAIYASPLKGSELAQYVSDPLPIAFSITENGMTSVTPQVLAISEDTNKRLLKFSYKEIQSEFAYSYEFQYENGQIIRSDFKDASGNLINFTKYYHVSNVLVKAEIIDPQFTNSHTEIEYLYLEDRIVKINWYVLYNSIKELSHYFIFDYSNSGTLDKLTLFDNNNVSVKEVEYYWSVDGQLKSKKISTPQSWPGSYQTYEVKSYSDEENPFKSIQLYITPFHALIEYDESSGFIPAEITFKNFYDEQTLDPETPISYFSELRKDEEGRVTKKTILEKNQLNPNPESKYFEEYEYLQ